MRKKDILLWVLPVLLIFSQTVWAQTATPEPIAISNNSRSVSGTESANPTQTPYVVYVVVTATPQAAEGISITNNASQTEVDSAELIQRTTPEAEISLTNSSGLSADEMIQSVVATLTAKNVTVTNTSDGTSGTKTDNSGQCVVQQSDGSSCTMSLTLVSEPNYGKGAKVGTDEVFWKEWIVQNTGTCTWTPDYTFVFYKGWQIGSTSFSMNKTTAPGETLNVRLGLTASLPAGKEYYSTYILQSPTGVQCGTITSTFTVETWKYFEPTPEPTPWRRPQHGRPAGPCDEPSCPPPGTCWGWGGFCW